MKKIIFVILMSFSVLGKAETVTFNLDRVPVIELARLIYSDVAKTDYAIDSSVLDMPNSVSVHFSDFGRKQAVSVLEDLLRASGVVVVKTGKVAMLRAVRDSDIKNDDEIFYYRPKFRSVGYIIDLCGSLFNTGHFSTQRNVSVSPALSSVANSPKIGAANSPQPVGNKPVENGTNAYSQISKEPDSFFFSGPQFDVDKLKKLLVQIDIPVPQVFVKGMVYEVTTSQNEGSAFGLAVSLLQGRFGLVIGGSPKIGDSISFKNASIDAVFSVLNSDSHFKSVSNPSLRVQSGASARFSVGSDVPVLGSVQLDKNGNPIQSVEYKPSGVIFDLKPQVRESGIDLTINQQLSSFIPTTSGVNNSPTLIKREISTSVGAVDNDVIVLGGLDEDKTSADSSGFSFLPDFLKSRGGQGSKTQILLVLQVQKI